MRKGLSVTVDGIIYQRQSRGGISRMYSEILPRMCALDDSLCIRLFTEGKTKQSLPTHRQIDHQVIPSVDCYLRPKWLWRPTVPRLRHFVRRAWIGRGKGQIWHSTYYTLPPVWEGQQVVTVLDMIHELLPDMFSEVSGQRTIAQKRRCIEAADAIICISETTRCDLTRFHQCNPEKVYVVYPSYSAIFRQRDIDIHRTFPEIAEPFLLYVGTRLYHKNFKLLLEAYYRWSKRDSFLLVVVGPGWSNVEKQIINRFGLEEQVILLTDISDEQLCQLYNRALAFVYPSLYEGFGIPLLEAMACGCPIVASRIPSTLEIAGDCPYYFEPTECNDLLVALDEAVKAGRDSERISLGLDRAQFYSWEKCASQTLEVYKRLAADFS